MNKEQLQAHAQTHDGCYPNSQLIRVEIERPKKDALSGRTFTSIFNDTTADALRDLTPVEFKVWTYLSMQKKIAFSPIAVANACGIGYDSAKKAKLSLVKKGYLTLSDDGSYFFSGKKQAAKEEPQEETTPPQKTIGFATEAPQEDERRMVSFCGETRLLTHEEFLSMNKSANFDLSVAEMRWEKARKNAPPTVEKQIEGPKMPLRYSNFEEC